MSPYSYFFLLVDEPYIWDCFSFFPPSPTHTSTPDIRHCGLAAKDVEASWSGLSPPFKSGSFVPIGSLEGRKLVLAGLGVFFELLLFFHLQLPPRWDLWSWFPYIVFCWVTVRCLPHNLIFSLWCHLHQQFSLFCVQISWLYSRPRYQNSWLGLRPMFLNKHFSASDVGGS